MEVSRTDLILRHGVRCGTVTAPPSKSHIQRLLICAALGSQETVIRCGWLSRDVEAVIACLRALGAGIERGENGLLHVIPVSTVPDVVCDMPCGESGAALRFLLPVVGALGVRAVFHREGRLSERPLKPLTELLKAQGLRICEYENDVYCEGKLHAGKYLIDSSVSSQFASGLLFALSLLDGSSELSLVGKVVSATYIGMTEKVLQCAGVGMARSGNTYIICGCRRFTLPAFLTAEGDWSGAAPFLCIGALSDGGVTVRGLSSSGLQGDCCVLDVLEDAGAEVLSCDDSVTVRSGKLKGFTFDAGNAPDLVPALAALGACVDGTTRIIDAARLRVKESNRLDATAAMLNALGADVRIEPDGLTINGRASLCGGSVCSALDHRSAMAASVAACFCSEDVKLIGAECIDKSYPAFWEDLGCLFML